MIGEWDAPFVLTSPAGSIALGGSLRKPPFSGYIFDWDGCDAGADLRVVRGNVPAEEGSIIGSVLAEGYVMQLKMWLMAAEETPACDAQLREMLDALGIHLWALRDPDSGGRIQWVPSGAASRMLDQIKILERGKVDFEDDICVVTFAVGTRYPYAMDTAEIVTSIGSGGGASLDNTGTAEFWPVFKVSGGSSFTLTNATTGVSIVYDSSRPGASGIGGGYLEIDTFRNTAYLNGDGANMMPGIDPETSDFWSLYPGSNSVSISGASVDVLWQAAWE